MIKAKFDPKYQMLLEAFDKELDQVKIIFDADKVIFVLIGGIINQSSTWFRF